MEIALAQSSRNRAQALGASANEHLAHAAAIKLARDLTAGVAACAIDGDL